MRNTGLDFEKPVLELERKIEDLKHFSNDKGIDVSEEIKTLEKKAEEIRKEIFTNLTPWQRIQIARHPQRPYSLDYIKNIVEGFIEFHGDRAFSDDMAVVGGIGKISGIPVMVVGQQKGRDIKENLQRNFGMLHPEGYRKAQRLFKMAEKFKLPLVCLVDTPGAYPGVGAEERGQAHIIAENQFVMSRLGVPVIVVVIGEGGSGGALGMGVGDVVLILENAYYSVISPEGCAAILWKDRAKAPDAAAALKLSASDLLGLGIVDKIVPEPMGGAHRDSLKISETLKQCITEELKQLVEIPKSKLIDNRYNRFRKLGVFLEEKQSTV
jgi:acetyl-CoA carboxylase carboxyl transferase subunit alpha